MLTEAECKNAVCPPDKKQARFADSGGMYLQVSPAGSKRWFLKYRVGGKEKQLALGSYPDVSLKSARLLARLGFGVTGGAWICRGIWPMCNIW
jgi:hypothetical protein